MARLKPAEYTRQTTDSVVRALHHMQTRGGPHSPSRAVAAALLTEFLDLTTEGAIAKHPGPADLRALLANVNGAVRELRAALSAIES